MRAALYIRVSTLDQHPQNQIDELRRYVTARGWESREFVDHGVSGARESRPALDSLLREARRRRVDVLLDEFQALQVPLISLREGLDLSTPAGRLQWQIIGAISEFERARIAERIRAGLARARTQGRRLGARPSNRRDRHHSSDTWFVQSTERSGRDAIARVRPCGSGRPSTSRVRPPTIRRGDTASRCCAWCTPTTIPLARS